MITVILDDKSKIKYDDFDKIINHDKIIELFCYYNQLTELPNTIDQLINLQTLVCSSNQLTELPNTIGQLTNLQKLHCLSNQLTELPNTIGYLKYTN